MYIRHAVAAAIATITLFMSPHAYGQRPTTLTEADQQIDALRAEIATLSMKVQALEQRLAALEQSDDARPGIEGAGAPAAENVDLPDPTNVLIVERVVAAEPDGAMLAEASRLRRDAASKRTECKALEKQQLALMGCGCRTYPECRDRDVHNQNKLTRERQRKKLGDMVVKLEQEAKRAEGDAARIEKDQKIPKHVIRGWDGKHTVYLRTTRDCTAIVNEAKPGTTITWWGRKTEFDDDEVNWEVSRIAIVPQPAGLTPREAPL